MSAQTGALRSPAVELSRARRRPARLRDRALGVAYRVLVGAVLLALVAPLIVTVFSSISETLFFSFPPRGFSTVAYERFLANQALREALGVSVKVGLATTVIAMLLAAPAAYAVDRFRFPGRRLIETVLMAPVMLPVLMLAVALLIFISQLQIPRSFAVLVAGHVLVATPFALRVLLTALAGFDRTLEEASASLGARPLETLRRVTMPLLQPGILSAAVLAFAMSFGQITISLFLAGEGSTTLPVEVFLIADFGYDVAITAVSVIVMAVALLVLVVIEKTTGLEDVV